MKNGPRTLLLVLGDIAVLVAAFWAMLYISFYGRLRPGIVHMHSFPFFIIGALWIVIFFIFNLYTTQATRPTIPHLRQIFLAFIVAAVTAVIFFYAIPSFGISPKTQLFIFTGISLIFFIVWRRVFYGVFSSHFKKSIVFITSGEKNKPQVADLKNYIAAYPQSGFAISGIYDSIEAFSASHAGSAPDMFIISKDIWRDSANFKKLYDTESDVMDLAYAYEDILGRIPLEAIDEDWFMHNIRSGEESIYDIEKRFSSIILSSLALVILSPVFLIIALVIQISDDGPVFYSQVRVGLGRRNFKLYKFRTMYHSADKNPDQAGTAPVWAAKKDTRVTSVGRILRVLHLDELPQLYNIWKGDIALVGPRPERPQFVAELEKEIPFYNLRHVIIPGFTGWAQIKFRYARTNLDAKQKFEYDLYYLKNRNIFLDLGIVARTLQIIFTHTK